MGNRESRRELSLHRETVRELSAPESRGVLGGVNLTQWDGTVCSGDNCIDTLYPATCALRTLSCLCKPI